MEKSYYKCSIILNEKKKILIQTIDSSEVDSFFLNKNGKISLFESVECLKDFAEKKVIPINLEENHVLNLDYIKKFSIVKDGEIEIDCEEVLHAWNFFDDICNTLNLPFERKVRDALTDKIYDKLFFGNNIPAIKPDDVPDYIPIWIPEEEKRLSEVLSNGMWVFKSNIEIEECI